MGVSLAADGGSSKSSRPTWSVDSGLVCPDPATELFALLLALPPRRVLSIDISDAGVAGAADPPASLLRVFCFCASKVGDCRFDVEHGRGGGPINASDRGSGEMEPAPELSVEYGFARRLDWDCWGVGCCSMSSRSCAVMELLSALDLRFCARIAGLCLMFGLDREAAAFLGGLRVRSLGMTAASGTNMSMSLVEGEVEAEVSVPFPWVRCGDR